MPFVDTSMLHQMFLYYFMIQRSSYFPKRKYLHVWTLSLKRYLHIYRRFSDTIDWTGNLTPQARGYLNYRVIMEDFNTVNIKRRFLHGNSNWKKPRGGREFTIVSPGYNGSAKYYCLYNLLDPLFCRWTYTCINTLWHCNWWCGYFGSS